MGPKTYYRIQRKDGSWDEDCCDGSPEWTHTTLSLAAAAKADLEELLGEKGLQIIKITEERVG